MCVCYSILNITPHQQENQQEMMACEVSQTPKTKEECYSMINITPLQQEMMSSQVSQTPKTCSIINMMSSQVSQTPKTKEEPKQQILNRPKDTFFTVPFLVPELYQGYWIPNIESALAFQNHFKAKDTDIILTSSRKAGSTWLKSLIYSICNRSKYAPSDETPLPTFNPHEAIPQLESNIYARTPFPDYLGDIESPRLFGTHLPFELLPVSIRSSNCKIVYICRNPFDTLISSWFFYMKVDQKLEHGMMEQYFEKFCKGEVPFGPFWDHALGYYRESIERPGKVLFLKYEEMKADPVSQLRKLAEFVGFPFTEEESKGGVVEDIVSLCSFEKLKESDAAIRGSTVYGVENKLFFRKGEVGDWVNHFTPAMIDKLEKIIDEKFRGSGLTFHR